MTSTERLNLRLFQEIARMRQRTLQKTLKNHLKRVYSDRKVIVTKDYLFAEGDIPILLVAHMDTVFSSPPTNIYYDSNKKIMWSPEGLGADDRAGVFAILNVIRNGYRPHICFTTDEEVGGLGALALTRDIPKPPVPIKYIIQLDRRGECDCVFYSCVNNDFQTYVEGFGFITNWGTFSDISYICPHWGIAGVNLSVGYQGEHTKSEILNIKALERTIDKVCEMLKDEPNIKVFEYQEDPYEYYNYTNLVGPSEYDFDDDNDWYSQYYANKYPKIFFKKTGTCSYCKQTFEEDGLIYAQSKDDPTKKIPFCFECAGRYVNWCQNCGSPFEFQEDDALADICPICKQKAKEDKVTNGGI